MNTRRFYLYVFCFFLSFVTISCFGKQKQDYESAARSEIQDLMRQALKWVNSTGYTVELLPRLPLLENDSAYIGYDLSNHEANLQKIRNTGFFAEEFIENYNKIVLTVDQKLRGGELEWLVGFLPSFGVDSSPWCLCQDIPYDEPCPWDNIEVKITDLSDNSAEAVWIWGLLDEDSFWNESPYNFRAIKEDGRWKISYLEGFDFERSIRPHSFSY